MPVPPTKVMDSQLPQQLYEAGRKGDSKEIRRLLQGFPLEEAQRMLEHHSVTTEPLLNIAVQFKQGKVVRELVDYFGVSVDATSDDESSPVMQSVLGGNVDILRMLARRLRDPNIGFPLHRVCGGETPNGVQVLRILIHGGADINLKNTKGLTPLMMACQKNNTQEMVRILLHTGAAVNLTAPDGNTALHYAIRRTEDMMKDSAWDRLNVIKWLVKHGAESKQNKQGLTPTHVACIKGNPEIMTFLAKSFCRSDAEIADCHELLASALYFNSIKRDGKFRIICTLNEFHYQSFKELEHGMTLRHNHSPPLWKFNNQDRVEGLSYHVETQTFDELSALKDHGEGLLVELILARQRVISLDAYESHLFPFLMEYFLYLKKRHHNTQAISLLTYKMHLQLMLPQRKFEHTVIFLLGLLRPYREALQSDRKDEQKVAEAVVAFFEECHLGDASEKRFLLRWLYLTPMYLLYLCLNNPSLSLTGRTNVHQLVSRFLRATKTLKESILSTHAKCEDVYLFGSCTTETYRAVAGDNAVHVACRHIPLKGVVDNRRESLPSTEHPTGLSALLLALHSSGEDINAQNSEGKTPLKVLIEQHGSAMTSEACTAVHTLLMGGADPDIKDKHEHTAVHAIANSVISPHFSPSSALQLKTVLEMLLKSGANPNAKGKYGFTPLHLLMDRTTSQPCNNSQVPHGANHEFLKDTLPGFVFLMQDYGGLPDYVTHDGRTAFDMCKDPELLQDMQTRLSFTRGNGLTLSRLAARTIRLRNVPYQASTPHALRRVVELED